ncbi:MAG: hypothetical protein NVSMB65_21010 [Chloroflexota bacterium]
MRALATPAAGHTLLIAQVTPAEVVSGVARRRREGRRRTPPHSLWARPSWPCARAAPADLRCGMNFLHDTARRPFYTIVTG